MLRCSPALLIWVLGLGHALPVAAADSQACPRPEAGGVVPEPPELRSSDGVLRLDLFARNALAAAGRTRYCFQLADGTQSPTLRLAPGDTLILNFHNALVPVGGVPDAHATHRPGPTQDPCSSGMMSPTSSNLHFHGLTVPPRCHQDEVLKTSVQPGDAAFEYRFRIPADEPPGLYWYHPHIHGFSSPQVLGGASGALIIEGLERAIPAVAGLPERVLVIRDQDLLNPDAPPSKSEPVVPKMMIDRDGDSANNGTGFGKPAKDLSVNFVPVPYPDYPTARIRVRAGERELWRVLNASAVTYLNLALLLGHTAQSLGIVAIDGVPINAAGADAAQIQWRDHIGIPPGGRVEFNLTAPPATTPALLVTRTVDTGQGGENDPNRALATVVAAADAPELRSRLPAQATPLPPPVRPWLGAVTPARVRRLYFSEKLSDPGNPNSATSFYITVEGQQPAEFDPASEIPNIVVHQGDVEDWIIENRSSELHAFHIHQIHFLLLDWSGIPVNEPFLRDTINVPYFNGRTLQYPSVRLRMDFRDPNSIGTFVYHCHLLEHEDGGMMGLVRVEAAEPAAQQAPIVSYLHSLSRPIHPRCEAGHYYLLNNYNPGYFGNGANAFTDTNSNNTVFTIPPSSVRSIGDSLLAAHISWKYYGDQWNNYVPDPYQLNYGAMGKNTDEYCNICNPFQYDSSIMANASIRKAHIQDTANLYQHIRNGTLPAVSFVKPSGLVDGHPNSSKLNLFEGFTKKIVDAVKANPGLWKDTAILITFDEGGGYYDSGYVQPLDFFGDGTRIPLIVVSPYTKPGHISHGYSDHVSILKFIERNWGLAPVTHRSRDNFPNPVVAAANQYVPLNTPAISDLFDLFDFQGSSL